MTPKVIFDSDADNDPSDWAIINDGVMGGKSESRFSFDAEGVGIFSGHISLENNGGFASARYRPGRIGVKEYSSAVVRLRGDDKRYQFRLKKKLDDDHSYVTYFDTTAEWQEMEFPLHTLYPTYRGRKLDRPNFSGSHVEEFGFLIGNNKEESFRLHIKSILLK